MINTQLNFEAKIPKGAKVVTFKRNYTKFLNFQGQYDLEDQGQGCQFQTHLRYLDDH